MKTVACALLALTISACSSMAGSPDEKSLLGEGDLEWKAFSPDLTITARLIEPPPPNSSGYATGLIVPGITSGTEFSSEVFEFEGTGDDFLVVKQVSRELGASSVYTVDDLKTSVSFTGRETLGIKKKGDAVSKSAPVFIQHNKPVYFDGVVELLLNGEVCGGKERDSTTIKLEPIEADVKHDVAANGDLSQVFTSISAVFYGTRENCGGKTLELRAEVPLEQVSSQVGYDQKRSFNTAFSIGTTQYSLDGLIGYEKDTVTLERYTVYPVRASVQLTQDGYSGTAAERIDRTENRPSEDYESFNLTIRNKTNNERTLSIFPRFLDEDGDEAYNPATAVSIQFEVENLIVNSESTVVTAELSEVWTTMPPSNE